MKFTKSVVIAGLCLTGDWRFCPSPYSLASAIPYVYSGDYGSDSDCSPGKPGCPGSGNYWPGPQCFPGKPGCPVPDNYWSDPQCFPGKPGCPGYDDYGSDSHCYPGKPGCPGSDAPSCSVEFGHLFDGLNQCPSQFGAATTVDHFKTIFQQMEQAIGTFLQKLQYCEAYDISSHQYDFVNFIVQVTSAIQACSTILSQTSFGLSFGQKFGFLISQLDGRCPGFFESVMQGLLPFCPSGQGSGSASASSQASVSANGEDVLSVSAGSRADVAVSSPQGGICRYFVDQLCGGYCSGAGPILGF